MLRACPSRSFADNLLEGCGEAIDVISAVGFGDAIERALAELREFSGDILAAEDAVPAQGLVDPRHGLARAVEIDHELLEEGLGKLDPNALDPGERLCRVVGLLEDQRANF